MYKTLLQKRKKNKMGSKIKKENNFDKYKWHIARLHSSTDFSVYWVSFTTEKIWRLMVILMSETDVRLSERIFGGIWRESMIGKKWSWSQILVQNQKRWSSEGSDKPKEVRWSVFTRWDWCSVDLNAELSTTVQFVAICSVKKFTTAP